MPPAENAPIPITSLDPQQLMQIRDRLETDIQNLSQSSTTLAKLAGAFSNSGKAIETLDRSKEGQPLLLPLTSSLYVPGSLVSTDKVLVDVGTGYFVEMTADEGKDFCKRKVTKLKENVDALAQVVRQKQNQLVQVNQLLAEKVQAMQGAGTNVTAKA